MKTFLFSFLVFLATFVASASQKFEVQIMSETCIKPLIRYHYLTCSPILVFINGKNLVIPRHFKTDLASIPRVFWSLMSPAHSSSFRAAILHDWLYHNPCNYSRYDADLIFYEALINDKLSLWRSYIIYYAVRAFGAEYYNEGSCHE